jgi:hypothetical protein
MTGNDSVPFASIEMEEVIKNAYYSEYGYKNTFEECKAKHSLCFEDDEMQYDEFRSIMEEGFRSKCGAPFANIDCSDMHINFEPHIALL